MASVMNMSTDNTIKPLKSKREVDKGGGRNNQNLFASDHCKNKNDILYINKNYLSAFHIINHFNTDMMLYKSNNILNENFEIKVRSNHTRNSTINSHNDSFVPKRKGVISQSSSCILFSKGICKIAFLLTVFCTIITAATAKSHYYSSNRNGLWDAHQKKCPMAFHEIGGRCYFYGYFPLNWFRAAEFCHSFGKGVSLASIETAQENYYIKQWLLVNGDHNSGVWIGGSDNGHEGRWAWFPTGQLLDYSNWGPSQPSGNDQHCMYMVGGILGFQWADFHCDFNMNFLCEHGVNDAQPW